VRVLGTDRHHLPPGKVFDIFLRSSVYGGSTYLCGAPQIPTSDDGFCSVGALGDVDKGVRLHVVDRRFDMIISGAANVFPAEVENVLSEHPKVADVVVIGLKDHEWGRRVHPVIEPAYAAYSPSFDRIATYARSGLHPYKAPKSIEIVEPIPRRAVQKVDRSPLFEARGG
jgi:bile acid-coenzyme A ligase